MDEPISALDPISTLKIEDLAQELKMHYTIVIMTHNLHFITGADTGGRRFAPHHHSAEDDHRYGERIGDRAVNIAERVVYAITGKHKEDLDDLFCGGRRPAGKPSQ